MKKENTKRILILSFLALILLITISNFLSPIVSAQSASDSLANLFSKPIEEFRNSWATGVWGEGFGKFFLGILILFLIWGILDTTGLIKNGLINFGISIVVAFLSTAYLLPSEIISVMQTYSALGLTIGVIFPFAVVLLFTFGAVKSQDLTGTVIQYILWIVFTFFIFYRLLISFDQASAPVSIMIGIIAIACMIMVFFNKKVMNALNKQFMVAIQTRVRNVEKEASSVTEARAETAEREAERRKLESEY